MSDNSDNWDNNVSIISDNMDKWDNFFGLISDNMDNLDNIVSNDVRQTGNWDSEFNGRLF